MEEQDQRYIKGFNYGYLLAKHEPTLAAQIMAQPNNNSYFEGLANGKEEYEKEVREWSKSFSKGNPTKDGKDLDKTR